jgi:hypothetical protein
MKIKVINVKAESLNAYADPIKQVINEAAGLSLVTSSLIRETTENESANAGYKFGQEEE